jgi:hypothetical protein
VRQLDAVARQLVVNLAPAAPLLPGAEVLAFIDMHSMQKRVYRHAKQGAGFGHTKIQGKNLIVRGLNALAAVISTPLGAPVIAATRLRGGKANSACGAASLAAEAISAARQTKCTGQVVFRIDSAYYSAAVLGAIRRAARASRSPCGWTPGSAVRRPPRIASLCRTPHNRICGSPEGKFLRATKPNSMTLVANTHDRHSATKRFICGWLSWISNAARSR